MVALKKHQKEKGCRPKKRPKPKSEFSINRLQRAGKLDGVSDLHVERGVAVSQVFSDPQRMRGYVRELVKSRYRRRVEDY